MSSLKPEDAVADYSTLDEKELAVLDDWVKYYKKVPPSSLDCAMPLMALAQRYNIIGKVVDAPSGTKL